MPSLVIESPLGPLTVTAKDEAIVALDIGAPDDAAGAAVANPTPLLREAKRQLDAYFGRRRRGFDLPLHPTGTPFQQRVWNALVRIPYGEHRRYGDLARCLASSPRAVGQACGSNPIPIIIPCHRVVGGHALGGYSGGRGAETKQRLLDLERIDLFTAHP